MTVAAGRPVVVVDDEDRENEGGLIFAAEKATAELMAAAERHHGTVDSVDESPNCAVLRHLRDQAVMEMSGLNVAD